MKQEKHEHRKSFKKWGMPGQRTCTETKAKLHVRSEKAFTEERFTHIPNIGKNNGPLKHSVPARNLSTQFQLHKHSCVNDPMGRTARVIASYDYADSLAGN